LRRKPAPIKYDYDAEGIRRVYGREFGSMKPPVGYEWLVENSKIAFRPRKADEVVAQVRDGCTHPFLPPYSDPTDCWLILKPKPGYTPVPKPRRWVFEETGDQRTSKPGEWFQWPSLAICRACGVELGEFPILRLVEKPE
jgi:hypothetical protein